MEIFNLRTLAAVLAGAALAGLLIGGVNLYKERQRERVAQKLFEVETLLAQNKTKEALKLVKELNPPSRAYGELLLGDRFFESDRFESSAKLFEGASEDLSKVDRPLSFYSLEKGAYALFKGERFDEALGLLEEIPPGAPNFCYALFLKARIYAKKGELQRAKESLEQVATGCTQPQLVSAARYLLVKIEGLK